MENVKSRFKGVTLKQEAFALAYCRLMNGSDAYREVYRPKKASAKTINEAACRLLKNSKVAARITELKAVAEKSGILAVDRTRAEIARLCFSRIGRVFNPDGSPKPIRELDDDTAAAIKRYDIQERVVDGMVVARTIRLEFWDKIAALDMAARHLGLYERDNAQRGETYRIVVQLVGDRDAATPSTELHPIHLTKER